jgi:hypothetical protein
MSMNRREFLAGTAGVMAGAFVSLPSLLPKYHFDRRSTGSRVLILNIAHYSQDMETQLEHAQQVLSVELAGKAVLLKPNIVDYGAGDAINTHPWLVRASGRMLLPQGSEIGRGRRGSRPSTRHSSASRAERLSRVPS